MRKKYRLFKLTCILIVLAVVGYSYARYVEPHMLTVSEETIITPILSDQVGHLKVVLFADTHLGEFFSYEMLDHAVQKVNRLNPDLIIFAGDLFEHYDEERGDEDGAAVVLSKMKAKYGKFAVFGNHDYGGDAYKIFDRLMEESGFEVLANEGVYIEELGVNVVGIDELMLGQGDPQLAETLLKQEAYNIVVCHEGDIADEMIDTYADLFLAGHTHGGQIQLPFYGPLILPPLGEKYVEGLYALNGGDRALKAFITTGLGTTKIPMRFLVKPEVCLLNVKSD